MYKQEEEKHVVKEPAAIYYTKADIVEDFSLLDTEKLYAYADYLKWQFKERVELIKGKIFKMSPAPTPKHQLILGDLFVCFATFLKSKTCIPFLAPFDVRFPNHKNDINPYTVVQPDICIVCDTNKIDDKGCNGAPDLIVEILSPSTAAKDINDKFRLYEEHKVKEYWIIDPLNKIVDIFLLDKKGKYQLLQKFSEQDQIKVKTFPGLQIDLKDIFQ